MCESHIIKIETSAHYQEAAKLTSQRLCSFLIGLAATQRGLKVRYKTNLPIDVRFQSHRPNFTGAYYEVSDGKSAHHFDQSMGLETLRKSIGAKIDDKATSKDKFKKNNVMTAKGVVVSKSSEPVLVNFMKQFSNSCTFVAKPVTGSLGMGVELNLTAKNVLNLITKSDKQWLVEEQLTGREMRVFAIGNSTIAAFERLAPHIRGDGRSTIRELIQKRNHDFSHTPDGRKYRIDDAKAELHLAETGLHADYIPKFLEEITLDVKNFAKGADLKDITTSLPDEAARQAILAIKALGLPIGGVDIIYDKNTNTAFVLEVNGKPDIGAHTFPSVGTGQGLNVPNAILDYYFPKSISKKSNPKFSLEFSSIKAALQTRSIEYISPMSYNASLVKVDLRLTESKSDAAKLIEKVRKYVHHLNWWNREDGKNEIELYLTKSMMLEFKKKRKASANAVIRHDIDAKIGGT